jgi:two-component system response regulator YesN
MKETYKLIVVDDELIILDGLQSFYWDRFQFKVIGTATNGKMALELMQHEAADVVLTDIKMPVMDGIELCNELIV